MVSNSPRTRKRISGVTVSFNGGPVNRRTQAELEYIAKHRAFVDRRRHAGLVPHNRRQKMFACNAESEIGAWIHGKQYVVTINLAAQRRIHADPPKFPTGADV